MEKIRGLPIGQFAAEHAHLYLWVPSAFIAEGVGLLGAWGFEYKVSLVWVKHQVGIGAYFRGSHELVLFGVRGRLPILRHDLRTWFIGDRRQHSRKPDEFYQRVEQASPGPRIDIFSREKREGWDQWGDQCDLFNKRPNENDMPLAVETQLGPSIQEVQEMVTEGRLLKVEEVAQLLGVSRHTVYGWVSDQRIPFRKVGGKLVRFDRQDLENWTRSQAQTSSAKTV